VDQKQVTAVHHNANPPPPPTKPTNCQKIKTIPCQITSEQYQGTVFAGSPYGIKFGLSGKGISIIQGV
jgi:hypothetical protein